MQSVPPLKEVFDMSGMELPKYLGSEKKAEASEEQ